MRVRSLTAKKGVRRARRSVVLALRRSAARRPAGDPWAFRLEVAARRIERSLKRVERALRPEVDSAETSPVSLAGIDRVRVDQPLALITQMGRSGGTLLLHLLDGHPQCLVVPHELSTMLPHGALPADAGRAFDALTPKLLKKWQAQGVRVGKGALAGEPGDAPPFDFSLPLLRELFVAEQPTSSDRAILDAYFSAYFSAWLDRSRSQAAARWIVGFEPRAIARAARIDRFDANYPDGRLISLLRDPWTWFASAQRWSLRLAHVDVALDRWQKSVEGALRYHERSPDRIELVNFEDLVLDTRHVMERLCTFLEISFDECLLVPTVNGHPADSNSSFGKFSGSVSPDPALGRHDRLPDGVAAVIEERVGDLWRSALGVLDAARATA